jgi:hypothetical protein
LERAHKKLDQILEQFDGLRRYLYENDPQFDEERQLLAGMNPHGVDEAKKRAGKTHSQFAVLIRWAAGAEKNVALVGVRGTCRDSRGIFHWLAHGCQCDAARCSTAKSQLSERPKFRPERASA